MNGTDTPKGYNKRLGILIGSVFGVITVIIVGIFLLLNNQTDDSGIKAEVEITEAERIEATALSKDFMKTVGNFGVISKNLTADNILDVSYILVEPNTDSSDYIVSRSDAYNNAKADMIFKGGPLDYNTKNVLSWNNYFELDKMATMELLESNIELNDKGINLNINEKEVKGLEVKVVFDSKETVRDMTANDASWDGSYSVLEKDFVNTSLTLTLVKNSDNEWRVFSIRDLDSNHLLATWESPNDSDSDSVDRQQGFKQVDLLERTEPFKEPKN